MWDCRAETKDEAHFCPASPSLAGASMRVIPSHARPLTSLALRKRRNLMHLPPARAWGSNPRNLWIRGGITTE